jgi:hypothetical protein
LNLLITLMLVWTNSRHHLVYSQTVILNQDGFAWLLLERGPWYSPNIFYSYAVIVAGLLVLIYSMWHSSPLLKNQYRVVLIAALIPALVNMYYETYGSAGHVDLAPLSFGISGILFTYSVVRNRFMDIIPVARTRFIEHERRHPGARSSEPHCGYQPGHGDLPGSRKPASLLGRPAVEILQPWMEKATPCSDGQETRVACASPRPRLATWTCA